MTSVLSAIAAGLLCVPVALALHWWWPWGWTGKRRHIKLNQRRKDWD